MMNSSFDDDDDNAFGANPFRSTNSGSGDEGDLLGTPNPTTQSTQHTLPNPSTLDPVSGFSGQLDNMLPSPQQQQFQQQQQQQQQQQFQQQQSYNNLTGSMDNARANVNNNQNNNNNNGGGQYGSNGNTGNNNTNGNASFFRLPTWGSCMACVRLDSYTQYFDVDTADVNARIRAAVTTFWKPDQFRTAVLGEAGNDAYKGPDLYGPLWVCMTLIFLIAVTSNLSAYMHHAQKSSHAHHSSSSSSGSSNSTDSGSGSGAAQEQEFEYDLHHLVRALTVVSSFVFGVPTFFWMATICLGMPGVSLALWICCYGYSMVPYQIAALLAWIPWEIVEWFVLASATAASALLVVRNLSTPLMQQDSSTHTKAAPLIMAMMGAHVCFLFVLKFTFYP
jgi:hypothetical protein